jgi:hypothetical protein
MAPVLRTYTCHPEGVRRGTLQLQIASHKGWVITQQSGGPSLSFGMTTRGVCLLHSNPASPMPATTARTYLQMRPACPRRTFSPDARFVRQK